MAVCTPPIHVFLGRPLFLLSSGVHPIINLPFVKWINSVWSCTELQSNFQNVPGSDTLFIFCALPTRFYKQIIFTVMTTVTVECESL
jgi:hypothetical protein